MKLIECVPNFSEGRDLEMIDQIVDAIKSSGGVILDVDPGADTNRTVVTFVADEKTVINAAFAGIKKASELIDMTKHKGAHARMGATDVCPLIPISEISIEECVKLSKELAEKVAKELNISTYLYEHSAKDEYRKNLANIRAGEYEGLFEKVEQPKWIPDFISENGVKHNKKSGSTVIGVREFLIAYNINLNTTSTLIARKIANRIREKGYPSRDEFKKLIKVDGKKVYTPGLFKNVKAVGWYIDEYKRAQISINLTNFRVTPIYEVFDAVCKLANDFGVRVTGSELVGLIPKDAIYETGLHYLKKAKQPYGLSEKEIIETAVQSLGLRELTDFIPEEKIIEYKVAKKRELVNMTILDFVDELASKSPAPGGGSIAALSASLSAGLTSMVAHLTLGKKKYKKYSKEMKEISFKAQKLKEFFLDVIDDDTDSFNILMDAFSLPKSNNLEKENRLKAIENATKDATLIPFSVLEKIPELLELTQEVVLHGNQSALSDGGVASLTANTAAYGAYYNVLINLQDITDQSFIDDLKLKANSIIKSVDKKSKDIQVIILDLLKK